MSKDLERFSATLAYIENHLFEDIILKDLAKKALLSEYTCLLYTSDAADE